MKPDKSSIRASKKKKWIIISTITLISLAAIFYYLFISVSGSSKPIEAVANEFEPGSQWTLIENEIIPPKFFCMDTYNGNSCPQVSRRWQIDSQISPSDFKSILQNTTWEYSFPPECEELKIINEKNDYKCSFNSRAGKYEARIYFSINPINKLMELSLYIK